LIRQDMIECAELLVRAETCIEVGATDKAVEFIQAARDVLKRPSSDAVRKQKERANKAESVTDRPRQSATDTSTVVDVDVEAAAPAAEKGGGAGGGNGRRRYSEDVQECWDHWRAIRPSTTRKSLVVGCDEYKKTVGRLKEGYTPDKIGEAARGFSRSPYHNGDNKDGWKFTYEFVVRVGTNIDRGIEMAEASTSAPQLLTRQAQSNIEAVIELTREAGI